MARLAAYRNPDDLRSAFELAITFLPFVGMWAVSWYLVNLGSWFASVSIFAAGCLMVRMFVIQHDCGHSSAFSSRAANEWIGRLIGILTLTPFEYWRHSHAMHHASSGNLDRRGFGDIDTMTVDEYLAKPWLGRLRYRLYRNPIVLFIIGPAYMFLLRHRFPSGVMESGRASISSVVFTNVAAAIISAVLIYFIGWKAFLIIQVPIVCLGATVGVWMFYVQHQFDETHWDRNGTWTHEAAALHGSSFYDLPKPLMWITGNIGIHHLHHLSSRIPFHRLPQVLKENPELNEIGRLTIWQSIKAVRLALWDEKARVLVSFRELARQMKTRDALPG
jgi:acyl-lipid omega-6 desaturase (Delta-12 desaturase)